MQQEACPPSPDPSSLQKTTSAATSSAKSGYIVRAQAAIMRAMHPDFRQGAREGFAAFLPFSIGLIPWAIVTGMTMVSVGLSPLEAAGMSLIVFAGTAQLGTLPLIAANAPLWLIIATALALNLRFIIFSAAIANVFHGMKLRTRWLAGHLLVDGVFAVCLDKLQQSDNPRWRLGFYLAPSLWAWLLWQSFCLSGIFFGGFLPKTWSLEFMATIALMVLVIPMAKARPMLVAALTGGSVAVLLNGLPFKLGLFAGIVTGIAAGFLAESRHSVETR